MQNVNTTEQCKCKHASFEGSGLIYNLPLLEEKHISLFPYKSISAQGRFSHAYGWATVL